MDTLKIAFYGKGGIGKSTIATNVSALLAAKGLRVLHIGCDPKADSTRLLTQSKVPTVLQQLERLGSVKREDLVFRGKNGVQCVEAGGPEAGCGCAGLGIMTAMEELEGLGIFQEHWDIIVYDVLGDVVCGGFSVPMRQHFVDKVFVVTSASYMSLYAANNILKGIKRYGTELQPLCGGLIGNHVKREEEASLLKEFGHRVSVPLLMALEEAFDLQVADYRRGLFALEKESPNSLALQCFVDSLLQPKPAVVPSPLQAEELESLGTDLGRLLYGK